MTWCNECGRSVERRHNQAGVEALSAEAPSSLVGWFGGGPDTLAAAGARVHFGHTSWAFNKSCFFVAVLGAEFLEGSSFPPIRASASVVGIDKLHAVRQVT